MVEETHVNKKQFAIGILWRGCNLFFSKGLTVVIAIYLARIIDPEHYGYMSIWSVFLSFGNVLVTFGTDTILIQKSNLNQDDWSTAFYSNMFRACILYFILFLTAPAISAFYKMPLLCKLIRIAGFDLFCKATINIGIANASKKINFKTIFIADFTGTLAGGISAIIIVQKQLFEYVLLSNVIVSELVYGVIIIVNVLPDIKLKFNFKLFIRYFKAGIKIVANGVFDMITSSFSGLFIGKVWDPTTIGYLNRGEKISQMFGVESYNVISGLLLPTLSSYTDDRRAFKTVGKRLLYMSSYIMFPLMMGLCVCSKRIVILLFTEKWLPAVPYARIICIYYSMNVIRQFCLQFNYAGRRYNNNTKVEFIRMVLILLTAVIVPFVKNPPLIWMSIYSVAVSIIVIIFFIDSIKKDIELKNSEIWIYFIKILMVSFVSMLPTIFLDALIKSNILFLFVAVLSAVVVYIMLSRFLTIESYEYLVNLILTLIKKSGFKNEENNTRF